jgi:hypothetical protein
MKYSVWLLIVLVCQVVGIELDDLLITGSERKVTAVKSLVNVYTTLKISNRGEKSKELVIAVPMES